VNSYSRNSNLEKKNVLNLIGRKNKFHHTK